MRNFHVDEMDKKIIDLLSVNARASNREIARELSVTERTIRVRVKRLLDEKIIRIGAITNSDRLKKSSAVTLWIDVESAALISQVAHELAAQPKFVYVATMLGRCDIVAVTLVENSEQLASYINETIEQVPGVRQVRYTLAHQFVKHDYRWTMII
jgi:Lrp/AsnC family transcriptional regulator, regulator for asnA, asnC and gidA